MGCSTSLAKMILFVFNVIFFIFGVITFSIGVWVVTNRSQLFKFVNLIDSRVSDSSNKDQIEQVASQHGLVEMAGYMLLCMGLVTLVVGFCGCFGAMKESTILLNIYAGLVTVVLVLELTAGIMAAVFQSRVDGEAIGALERLQNKFFVALPELDSNSSTADSAVTMLINYMQVSLECCGARAPGDIANSTTWLASNREFSGRQLQTPITCCKLKNKEAVLSATYDWKSFNASDLVDANCPFETDNKERHDRTCYEGIVSYVSRYARPLIGISIFVALVELCGILIACCLIRALDNDKNYAK